MVLPHAAPANAVPLCGSVYKHSELLWNFQREEFAGRAHLLCVDDVPTVVFVGCESKAVEKVISLRALSEGESLGIKASIELKIQAAAMLVTDYLLTDVEHRIATQVQLERAERLQAELAKRQAAERAAKEERQRQREAKRLALMGRERYNVIGTKQRKLSGLPVMADEWECLADGTWCVLVEGYSPETGRSEALIEHFVVSKKGGRVERKAVTSDISFPSRAKIEPPKPAGQVLVEFDGDIHEVPVYDRTGLEQLKQLKIPTTWAVQAADGLAVGKITISPEGKVAATAIPDAKLFQNA